ncbi:hypothetical protein [Amycolatopsis sp. NPDC003731]
MDIGKAEHPAEPARADARPQPAALRTKSALLGLQQRAGNRAVASALSRLVVQRAPDRPVASRDLTELDQAALEEERNRTHAAMRTLPENSPERADLLVHVRAVEREIAGRIPPPTIEDLMQIILHQRAFGAHGATPRRPARVPVIDPRGVGSRSIGTGYEVHVAMLVTDAAGRQVTVVVREYSRGSQPHAEAQGVATLLAQLGPSGVPGGRLQLVLDQDPCPDCTRLLNDCARQLRLSRLEVVVPTRAARGGRLAAPRTAARGWTQGSTPRITRVNPTPRMLWVRDFEVPTPAPRVVAGPASGTAAPQGAPPQAAPAEPTYVRVDPAEPARVRVTVDPEPEPEVEEVPARVPQSRPQLRATASSPPARGAAETPWTPAWPPDQPRTAPGNQSAPVPEAPAPYRPQPGDRVRVVLDPPATPAASTPTPATPAEPAPVTPAGSRAVVPGESAAATPAEPAPATPRGGPRSSGGAGGSALAFAAGFLYQWLHQRNLGARRDREGYAPVGSLPEEGLLGRLGRALMDPTLDTQTDPAARLNVRVWRRWVAAAVAANGGRPFGMTYQLHSRDHGIGFQRVQNLNVEYGRRPDGTWHVVHADRFPPGVEVPDLGRIIDLQGVSDLEVEIMLGFVPDTA